MASPKKFFFDVWLAQGKTVYRDVPYEVVTDWLQQGRLLGDDRIRPAKTEEWFLIEKVPAFAGFVPKVDPLRSDAKAEALEPMETGFAWGRPEDAEFAKLGGKAGFIGAAGLARRDHRGATQSR